MFIHPRTDARAMASKARLKWHIISRHATTSLAVTSAVYRNRKNDRIRLNYVFHLASGGFRRPDREGKRRKTHRGFSTNETFGVYLSRRGPSVFRSAGACLYGCGGGWKRAGRGRRAIRFHYQGRSEFQRIGRRLLRVWRPGGFARWLGD